MGEIYARNHRISIKLQLKLSLVQFYNSTLSLVNVAKESRETLKRHDNEHKHQHTCKSKQYF